MDLSTFLHDRRPSWKRLEELLERAESSGLSCLNEDEAVEFGNLYRRAASDLNQAQTFVSGDVTVRYLNDLVARAYLLIYGKTKIDLWALLMHYVWSYPAVLRRHWRPLLLATALFAFGAVFSFLACTYDADVARPLLMPNWTINPQEESERAEGPMGGAGELSVNSSMLYTHNLSVTLIAFALGITFGVGTAWSMFENGLIMGAVGALFVEKGQTVALLADLLPHGVLEIPAMLIGAAAGFVLAEGLIRAAPSPRREQLARSGKEAFLLASGAVVLLAFAGVLEAVVARAPTAFFSNDVKLSVAGVVGLAFFTYVVVLGWGRTPDPREKN